MPHSVHYVQVYSCVLPDDGNLYSGHQDRHAQTQTHRHTHKSCQRRRER